MNSAVLNFVLIHKLFSHAKHKVWQSGHGGRRLSGRVGTSSSAIQHLLEQLWPLRFNFKSEQKNESLEWKVRLENHSKKCGVNFYQPTPIHRELGTKIPVGSVLILLFKAIC